MKKETAGPALKQLQSYKIKPVKVCRCWPTLFNMHPVVLYVTVGILQGSRFLISSLSYIMQSYKLCFLLSTLLFVRKFLIEL